MAPAAAVTRRTFAKLNQLERQIVKAQDDIARARADIDQSEAEAEAARWAQAEEVYHLLKPRGNLTTRQVAAGWRNPKTKQPYTHPHVTYTAKVWKQYRLDKPTYQGTFATAYKAVKTAPSPNQHQSTAARAPKSNLPDDPLVVAWVQAQRQAGKGRDDIIAASKAGTDHWPRPGASLSKAVMTEIERNIKRGNLPTGTPPRVRQARQREASSRMTQIADELKVKNAAMQEMEKINRMGLEVSATLYHIDLAALTNLGDKFLDRYMDSAFDTLVNLYETIQLRLNDFARRASDKAVRDKLAYLRNPSGRSGPEAATARAIADEIERKHFGPRGLSAPSDAGA